MDETISLFGPLFTQKPDQFRFTQLNKLSYTLHFGHYIFNLMARYPRYRSEHSHGQIILDTRSQRISITVGASSG